VTAREASAPLQDAALVARCRSGDQAAWSELVERFSRYVYAICVQAYRLADADAEEVFQEVFARVFARLDTLRDPAALRPWIGQLTRRLCVDRLRRAGRERLEEQADRGTEEIIAELEEAIAVRQAMAGLPAECQEILDRFFCRDQSYAEITEALGLPSGTIASRISRCLARLRTALGADREPGRSPTVRP
jgi:RNA polymerase sigma factor (sigma-70 family)